MQVYQRSRVGGLSGYALRRNAGSSLFITDRPKFCDLRTEVGSSVGCKFQDVVSTWTGREGWVWV